MLGLADLSNELSRLDTGGADRPRRLLNARRASAGGTENIGFRPGESLRGGLADKCALSGLPNSWIVLREAGLKHRNRVLVSEDSGLDVQVLADALGVDPDDVSARRYAAAANRARDFFGITVPIGSIESRVRRFSPSFLAQHGYHLAAWELKFLPFCPETWELLESTCAFCKPEKEQVQGWTRTLTPVDRCDECGRLLCGRPSIKVAEDMRGELGILTSLVSVRSVQRHQVGRLLPEALAGARPQALLDVILALAKSMAVPRCVPGTNNDVDRLYGACKAIAEWPRGIHDIEFSASPSGPTLPLLMQRYAALGCEPAIKTCAAAYLPERAEGSRGDASDMLELIGIREATTVAGLDDDILRAAWEHRLLPQRYRAHGPRLVMAFEPSELRSFAKAWKDRVSSGSIAYRFGLPAYGIEQCAILGVMDCSPLALPGARFQFARNSGERLLQMLTAVATQLPTEAISLHEATREFSGGLKPWGPILKAIKDQTLPMLLADGPDNCLAKRILLDQNAFATLRAELALRTPKAEEHSQLISQSDALEILNCSGSSLKILSALECTGANPILFRLTDVTDLTAKVIATADIAGTLGVEPSAAFKLLEAARIPQVVAGGWERERATAFCSRVRDLRASQLVLEI